MSFETLGLSVRTLKALPEIFSQATRIQQLAIPAVLQDKNILALAKTGSGKTLAYCLPIIDKMMADCTAIQALVLVPTRELASQISNVINDLARDTGVDSLVLCGGVEKEWQVKQLQSQPQIVVATPGRLIELIHLGDVTLNHISHLVLDEADRLLDMGFWPDISHIAMRVNQAAAEKCKSDPRLNSNRCYQTLLFSATYSERLEDKVSTLTQDLVRIDAEPSNNKPTRVNEQLYLVNKGSKTNVLIDLINKQPWKQVLVFINAKESANALCRKLNKAGIASAALHGNKDHTEREETLALFKKQQTKVLIATDLLARGIHVEALPVVVNFELPPSPEVYVHRIGRTARAGVKGAAISLVCHGEIDYLEQIQSFIARPLSLQELADYPVTDKPSSSQSKRAPRDKKANRRTNSKKSIKQFKKR
jgi:superfamily II DNA/RNA helicase